MYVVPDELWRGLPASDPASAIATVNRADGPLVLTICGLDSALATGVLPLPGSAHPACFPREYPTIPGLTDVRIVGVDSAFALTLIRIRRTLTGEPDEFQKASKYKFDRVNTLTKTLVLLPAEAAHFSRASPGGVSNLRPAELCKEFYGFDGQGSSIPLEQLERAVSFGVTIVHHSWLHRVLLQREAVPVDGYVFKPEQLHHILTRSYPGEYEPPVLPPIPWTAPWGFAAIPSLTADTSSASFTTAGVTSAVSGSTSAPSPSDPATATPPPASSASGTAIAPIGPNSDASFPPSPSAPTAEHTWDQAVDDFGNALEWMPDEYPAVYDATTLYIYWGLTRDFGEIPPLPDNGITAGVEFNTEAIPRSFEHTGELYDCFVGPMLSEAYVEYCAAVREADNSASKWTLVAWLWPEQGTSDSFTKRHAVTEGWPEVVLFKDRSDDELSTTPPTGEKTKSLINGDILMIIVTDDQGRRGEFQAIAFLREDPDGGLDLDGEPKRQGMIRALMARDDVEAVSKMAEPIRASVSLLVRPASLAIMWSSMRRLRSDNEGGGIFDVLLGWVHRRGPYPCDERVQELARHYGLDIGQAEAVAAVEEGRHPLVLVQG